MSAQDGYWTCPKCHKPGLSKAVYYRTLEDFKDFDPVITAQKCQACGQFVRTKAGRGIAKQPKAKETAPSKLWDTPASPRDRGR